MLRLVGWERHHSDVCNHVLVLSLIIDDLGLVLSVEDVEELCSFPDSVCAEDEVLLVLAPVNVAHGEVVVLGHLERAATAQLVLRLEIVLGLYFGGEVVDDLIVNTHLL